MLKKRAKTLFILTLIILFPVIGYAEGKAEYAVIITIDGLSPEAIEKANTPNLDLLIKEGSFTPNAQTDRTAVTLPSHTSLVTGLTSDNHGMKLNLTTEQKLSLPSIFTIARENGISTLFVAGKEKMAYIYPSDEKGYKAITQVQLETIGLIADWYIESVEANKPGLSMIHFPYPDLAGHAFGWITREYLLSVEMVDTSIGKIINALKKNGMYDTSFIVITSDHGGDGKTHGEFIPGSEIIPWLAVGYNVKKDYKIKEKIYIYDTGPTALWTLGLNFNNKTDGRVVKDIFQNTKDQ